MKSSIVWKIFSGTISAFVLAIVLLGCGSTNSPIVSAPSVSNSNGIQTRANSGKGVAALPPELVAEFPIVPETTLIEQTFPLLTQSDPPNNNYWIVWKHAGLNNAVVATSVSGETAQIPVAQLPIGSNTVTATAYQTLDKQLSNPLKSKSVTFNTPTYGIKLNSQLPNTTNNGQTQQLQVHAEVIENAAPGRSRPQAGQPAANTRIQVQTLQGNGTIGTLTGVTDANGDFTTPITLTTNLGSVVLGITGTDDTLGSDKSPLARTASTQAFTADPCTAGDAAEPTCQPTANTDPGSNSPLMGLKAYIKLKANANLEATEVSVLSPVAGGLYQPTGLLPLKSSASGKFTLERSAGLNSFVIPVGVTPDPSYSPTPDPCTLPSLGRQASTPCPLPSPSPTPNCAFPHSPITNYPQQTPSQIQALIANALTNTSFGTQFEGILANRLISNGVNITACFSIS